MKPISYARHRFPVPAQKPILHKNLSGLGIGLPMKIATDDF
jgi:hypothetical protein